MPNKELRKEKCPIVATMKYYWREVEDPNSMVSRSSSPSLQSIETMLGWNNKHYADTSTPGFRERWSCKENSYEVVPPQVEYRISEKGLKIIAVWGQLNLVE